MKLSGVVSVVKAIKNKIGNQAKSETRTLHTILIGKLSFSTPGCSPRIVVFEGAYGGNSGNN